MGVGLNSVRTEFKHLPQCCRAENIEMNFPKHCGTKVAHEKNLARSQSSSALICEANSSLLLNVLAKMVSIQRWGKLVETVNMCPGLFYLPDYKHPWKLSQFVYIFPITMEVSFSAG